MKQRSKRESKEPNDLAVVEQRSGPTSMKCYSQFKELRSKGLKVKHWWFRTRSSQLMLEMHPEADFKFSPGWFGSIVSSAVSL